MALGLEMNTESQQIHTHTRLSKSVSNTNYSSCIPGSLEHRLPIPAAQTQKKDLSAEIISNRREYIGYAIIFLASFHLSLGTAVTHYNQTTLHYSSLETVHLLSLQLFCYSCLYILTFSSFGSIFSPLTRSDYVKLTARGIFGLGTLTTITVALKFLPSSDATAIFYLNPILSVILSSVVLSEKVGKSCFFSSILAFVGVIFVSMDHNNESHPHRLVGIVFALLSALLGSTVPVLVRALVSSVHFITSVFSLGTAGLIFCTFLGETVSLYNLFQKNSWHFILISLAPGLFVFIGQFFLGMAFKYCNAGTGSVMRNSEIPFIYLISVVLFNQQIVPMRLFGSGLIAMASVIVALGIHCKNTV